MFNRKAKEKIRLDDIPLRGGQEMPRLYPTPDKDPDEIGVLRTGERRPRPKDEV